MMNGNKQCAYLFRLRSLENGLIKELLVMHGPLNGSVAGFSDHTNPRSPPPPNDAVQLRQRYDRLLH